MTVLYIGNHTSSSKGYTAMARQIIKNEGNTFAFFTRNPRGGKAKAIDETDIQNFLVLAQENHFGKIVAQLSSISFIIFCFTSSSKILSIVLLKFALTINLTASL